MVLKFLGGVMGGSTVCKAVGGAPAPLAPHVNPPLGIYYAEADGALSVGMGLSVKVTTLQFAQLSCKPRCAKKY